MYQTVQLAILTWESMEICNALEIHIGIYKIIATDFSKFLEDLQLLIFIFLQNMRSTQEHNQIALCGADLATSLSGQNGSSWEHGEEFQKTKQRFKSNRRQVLGSQNTRNKTKCMKKKQNKTKKYQPVVQMRIRSTMVMQFM